MSIQIISITIVKTVKKGIESFIHNTISAKFGIGSTLILVVTCLLLPLSILEKNEIWIFKYHFNPFSKDDYYWLFSTIAQAIAALFGIGGMFTAYVLQIINNSIKENETKAREIFAGWGHTEISTLNGEEFLKKLIEYNERPKSEAVESWMRRGHLTLKQVENNLITKKFIKKLIINGVKNLAVFMSLIIFLSLVALPFSSHLSELIFGFMFGIFTLLLILISIFKMIRFIFVVIKG